MEREKPPPLAKVVVRAGSVQGLGIQLNTYNSVIALTPGGHADVDGVDLQHGDKILGIEVEGRRVLCSMTQALSDILPRDATQHTLLVLHS